MTVPTDARSIATGAGRATRRAFLIGSAGAALTLGLSTSASAALTLPVDPGVWIFGDSYTKAVGASTTAKGWAYLVGPPLGWRTTVFGEHGSGYCNETTYGAGNFEQRLWKLPSKGPDLLVLQGSTNDTDPTRFAPDALAGAINRTIRVCQRRWPATELLFLGPMTPYGNPDSNLIRVNGKVGQYVKQHGKTLIDAVAGTWFVPGDGARYAQPTGPGKGHPDDAGHQVIADRFVGAVRAL